MLYARWISTWSNGQRMESWIWSQVTSFRLQWFPFNLLYIQTLLFAFSFQRSAQKKGQMAASSWFLMLPFSTHLKPTFPLLLLSFPSFPLSWLLSVQQVWILNAKVVKHMKEHAKAVPISTLVRVQCLWSRLALIHQAAWSLLKQDLDYLSSSSANQLVFIKDRDKIDR